MNTNAAVQSLPASDIELEGMLTWNERFREWEFDQKDSGWGDDLAVVLRDALGDHPGRVRIILRVVEGS